MKWGILSYGTIAPKFIHSLLEVEGQELKAIATRSNYQKAKTDYPQVVVYDDYQDLINDPKIEIIYLCSTHNTHFEYGIQVLKAGKHLLCEKPMTTNSDDTKKLVEEARKQNKFLMEGIWTRCMPAYRKIMQLIDDDAIGKVEYFNAHFSFFNDWGPERRLYNKNLAGGATFDVGIYNLSLAFDIFGEIPESIKSLAYLTPQGVDKSTSTIIKYKGGQLANLHCGFRLDTDHKAIIFGSSGWIEMEVHWKVQHFVINQKNKETEEIFIPFQANGYVHEIKEAVQCIWSGKIESQLVSHSTSINLAKAMDIILEDIGYK